MKILGIETSCDETAAAVVQNGQIMLSNVVASSVDLHAAFGGVVPEIAARSHLESILPVVQQALTDASCDWGDIDAIAVTYGPGLIGSLLIGVMTARTLAIAKSKPLYAINHVEAHVYANFITDAKQSNYQLNKNLPQFPCVALIVSGGHSQLALFSNHGSYKLLGQTRDDAVGEAFDKVAKIAGLPYPGGPSVAAAAAGGDPQSIKLPISHLDNPYDFSFSGLKTAVLRAAQELVGETYAFASAELPGRLNSRQVANLAASFQFTAAKTLVKATTKAVEQFNPKSVVVAGGVAANAELRRQLDLSLSPKPLYSDIKLCTDNAAMIASLAYFRSKIDQPADVNSLSPQPSLTM